MICNYPPDASQGGAAEEKLRGALNKVGVPSDVQKKIFDSFKGEKGDKTGMIARFYFNQWVKQKRTENESKENHGLNPSSGLNPDQPGPAQGLFPRPTEAATKLISSRL